MEELDLRRIEFFIFQLFETFLAYLSTLSDLILHPTRVLDALARKPTKTDDDASSATPPASAPPATGEPADAAATAAGPDDEGEAPTTSVRENLKASRWRLGGDALDTRRRRRAARETRFVFETEDHGVPTVCYPGIFALTSFLLVILLEWVQVSFIRYRVDTPTTNFEGMQLEILVLFGTLFLLAQFADRFYEKRNGTRAPRQVFALCCYCSGYLVPKHGVPLLTFAMEDLLSKKALIAMGLLQLPFLLGMGLFWIFGVRRIYGGRWSGTLRLAMNACIGASVIYSMGQLLVHVPLLARNVNQVHFDSLERQRKYGDALVLGERIRRELPNERERRLLSFRLDRLRYHLLADNLERLGRVSDVLRPWVMTPRPKVDKGEEYARLAVLEDLVKRARAPLEYEDREFASDDAGLMLQVGTGGVSLTELHVPKRPVLLQPLAQAPKDLPAAIDRLRRELRENVQRLIHAGDTLFTRLHRHSHLKRLDFLAQRCAHRPNTPLKTLIRSQEIEAELEKIFWKMEKQRLASMIWLRDYPERLVDASILPQSFESADSSQN